jgi:hypothetical protein
MKTEFLLVTSTDFVAFQDRVNKLLGKGYQILGSPFSHGGFVCLAMFKTTEEYQAPIEYPAAAPEGT